MAESVRVRSTHSLLAEMPDSIGRLAEFLEEDAASVLTSAARSDAVAFVGALVLSDPGLEKHAAWRRTWDLQRREDLGESVGDLPSEDRQLIVACMASRAEERPRDGSAFVDRLRAIAGVPANQVADAQLPSNELSPDEARVIGAFAQAYPFAGSTLSSSVLSKHAESIHLRDPLRFGLAVASLEAKEYVISSGDDERYWTLTATGRNWLASNADAILRLKEDDGLPF